MTREAVKREAMKNVTVIETTALTKRYGDVEAVKQLTLRVRGGCITGFLGRNGAGKSSTIKMLLGMSHPTSGTGRVLGRAIGDSRASRELRAHVAYVAEDKQTYGYMTVAEMIAFTRSFYADWRPDAERRLLKQFDLPSSRKVKALSKGMRTKLALLLALARRPELLILDEPSEGLDPVSIEELLQALVAATAEGASVFFSSHQIAEVERIADHVCMLDQGRLVVDASLDAIRCDYRRVDIGFAGPPPARDWASDDVSSVRIDGRQVTIMARRNVDAIVERAYAAGAVSVESSAVSLRELFLDSVMPVAGPA
jgi:ABC-2 type transport system ATP-binding protein